MRPLRSYWHWFLGTACVLAPMAVIPVMVAMDWGWRRRALSLAPMAVTLLLAGGMVWIGWVSPVIELRYLRLWRPTLPTARRSMAAFIYVPALLLAFIVHLSVWGFVAIRYLTGQPVIGQIRFTPNNIAWMAATGVALLLTWRYQIWYDKQYIRKCRQENLCAACGYDLRVNSAGCCPECGAVGEPGIFDASSPTT